MKIVELDASQRAAVDVEADARQLVVAGPGSGKTEVVSNLIAHLIEDEDVDPTDGILVISFSNAAVYAADARLRANDAGPVTVQTMDSLAGEVIHDLSADDIAGLGFDQRIKLATRLLSEERWDRLDDLEHLVVDEVQDIVGVRADFLLEILRVLPIEAGFSLLGDPAQGIYDWQLRAENRPLSPTTSLALLARVRNTAGVEVKQLTGQYRAISRDARRVIELREAVNRGDPEASLEEFFAGLVAVETVPEVVERARAWSGTTAFLTANNGQALLTAAAVARAGGRVEVRRSAHQRVLAQWVARLLGTHPNSGITRAEVGARAAALLPDPDPDRLWRALRSVTGGRGREIALTDLARGLRRPRPLVPDLIEQNRAQFVVSTIHRAKGLEFDNVVYLDFHDKSWLDDEPADDDGEASRRLFVALSRARQTLIRAGGPDDRWLHRTAGHGGGERRWYMGGPKKWMTHGFEIRADDIDDTEPAGQDRAASQAHIAAMVRPGDPLDMRLDLARSSLQLPFWELLHGDVVVARTSAAFGESLARRLGPRDKAAKPWPHLTGARVEGLSTISGDAQQGDTGRHGLWLSPVCAGMLHIDWNGDDRD